MNFEKIADLIKNKYNNIEINLDEKYITAPSLRWYEIASFIKNEPDLEFDFLKCISSIDAEESGYYVAYNFYSVKNKHHIEVRVFADNMEIPSISKLWKGANWHEREAFDLMGVVFTDHPDLRRILLPEDWKGYPLQKKYNEPNYYHGMPVPKDKSEWE